MGIILKTHSTVCFNILLLLSNVHSEASTHQDLETILQKKPFSPCIFHRAYFHELYCELLKVLKTELKSFMGKLYKPNAETKCYLQKHAVCSQGEPSRIMQANNYPLKKTQNVKNSG